MAEGKRELEGEVAAWLAKQIPEAVWAPKRIQETSVSALNPFRKRQPVSEALLAHMRGWERAKFRGMVKG